MAELVFVDIMANCSIIRAWSALRCASFAAICWMAALKTVVFASFEADDCVRTDAERFAMCASIDATIVSAVPLSETSSSADKPANRLFVP